MRSWHCPSSSFSPRPRRIFPYHSGLPSPDPHRRGLYPLGPDFGPARKREGAGIVLAGIVIILVALINDVLYDNGILKTGQFIYLGLFLFTFFQSFFLSLRVSKAFSTVETQGQALAETNRAMRQEMNERQLAEMALLESEKRYRTLMEEAPIGLCNLDIQGTILFVNRRLEEYTGYRREEVIGRNGLTLELFPGKCSGV